MQFTKLTRIDKKKPICEYTHTYIVCVCISAAHILKWWTNKRQEYCIHE